VIYLAFRHRRFAHHDFEMVNQRLHFGINIRFFRQVKIGRRK
jgi:hypothetical protein